MKRIFLILLIIMVSTTSVAHASIIDNITSAVGSILGSKNKTNEVDKVRKTEERIENFIDMNLYESLSEDKKSVVKTLVEFENSVYRFDFDNLYIYFDVNKNDKVYDNLIDFAKEDENVKKFIRLMLEDTKVDVISINEISNNSYKVELQINTFDIEELGKKVIPKILSGNIFGILTNKLVIDNNFISNAIGSANSVLLDESVSKKDEIVTVILKKQNDRYVFSGVQRFINNVEDYLKNMLNVMNN